MRGCRAAHQISEMFTSSFYWRWLTSCCVCWGHSSSWPLHLHLQHILFFHLWKLEAQTSKANSFHVLSSVFTLSLHMCFFSTPKANFFCTHSNMDQKKRSIQGLFQQVLHFAKAAAPLLQETCDAAVKPAAVPLLVFTIKLSFTFTLASKKTD